MIAAFRMFETNDLDEVYNFDEMSIIQKGDLVDEIFNRERQLGKEISCQIMKRLFFFEIDRVHHHHKDEIVFNLKGKLSFRQIQEIILSFF